MAARVGLRQFWKQCRDRGERRGCGAWSYVPRGTLESESPMVSYLRVAGITRTLWRNIPRRNSGVRYNRRAPGAGVQTFSQQFSKLEPSYPWYLILLKCRETSWRKKCTDGRVSERGSKRTQARGIGGGGRSDERASIEFS